MSKVYYATEFDECIPGEIMIGIFSTRENAILACDAYADFMNREHFGEYIKNENAESYVIYTDGHSDLCVNEFDIDRNYLLEEGS